MESFLILSNGRTGSTWLSTSLGACKDLLTRGEVKWAPRGFTASPHHIVLDAQTDRLAEVLENRILRSAECDVGELRAYGSKFVFDPHFFLDPQIYKFIDRMIPRDMRLIHLRRAYLQIFLSFNSRGAVHQVSEKHRTDPENKIDPAMWRHFKDNDPSHRPPRLVLVAWRRVKVALLRKLLEDNHVSVYDFVCFLQEILNYYFHDVHVISYLKDRQDVKFVDYADVRERLPELAGYLGSRSTAREIEDILNAPYVEKLPQLPYELAWPTQMVQYLCQILDDEVAGFVASDQRLEDMIRWDSGRRVFTIVSRRLYDFMRMSEGAWKRRRKPVFWLGADGTVCLRPTKPIQRLEQTAA